MLQWSDLFHAESSIRETYPYSYRYVKPRQTLFSFCWLLGHWELKRVCPSFPESGSLTSKRERRGDCLLYMSKYSSFQTRQIVYSPSFYLGISPNSSQTQKKKKEKWKNSFYETSITLIPQPHKDITHKKKKKRRDLYPSYRCKTPQQSTSNWI